LSVHYLGTTIYLVEFDQNSMVDKLHMPLIQNKTIFNYQKENP